MLLFFTWSNISADKSVCSFWPFLFSEEMEGSQKKPSMGAARSLSTQAQMTRLSLTEVEACFLLQRGQPWGCDNGWRKGQALQPWPWPHSMHVRAYHHLPCTPLCDGYKLLSLKSPFWKSPQKSASFSITNLSLLLLNPSHSTITALVQASSLIPWVWPVQRQDLGILCRCAGWGGGWWEEKGR